MSKIRKIEWYCDKDDKWNEFIIGETKLDNCSNVLITEILTGKEIKDLFE